MHDVQSGTLQLIRFIGYMAVVCSHKPGSVSEQ